MKKAIVVVSFGTSDHEVLKFSIESVENNIRDKFPDYEVRRAFTSPFVIKKLAERDGIHIDTRHQALARLQLEGYQEVVFVSLEEPCLAVNQYSHG